MTGTGQVNEEEASDKESAGISPNTKMKQTFDWSDDNELQEEDEGDELEYL